MMKVRSHQTSPEVNSAAIRLYNYALRYYAEHGYAPTVREIRNSLNISSTSMIDYYLNVLTKWRWIVRHPGRVRAIQFIRVTERGLSAVQIAALYGWHQQALSYAVATPKRNPVARRTRKLKKKWLSIREQIRPFKG